MNRCPHCRKYLHFEARGCNDCAITFDLKAARTSEDRSPPVTGWAAGEYLCADGEWKPCQVGPPVYFGYALIEANGVQHNVPSANVRQPNVGSEALESAKPSTDTSL